MKGAQCNAAISHQFPQAGQVWPLRSCPIKDYKNTISVNVQRTDRNKYTKQNDFRSGQLSFNEFCAGLAW
jgi:hypothetical protein